MTPTDGIRFEGIAKDTLCETFKNITSELGLDKNLDREPNKELPTMTIRIDKVKQWLQCGVIAEQISQEETTSIIDSQELILSLRKKIAVNRQHYKETLYHLGLAKIDWDFLSKECEDFKA